MSNREALYSYSHPAYEAATPHLSGLLSALCLGLIAAAILVTNLV